MCVEGRGGGGGGAHDDTPSAWEEEEGEKKGMKSLECFPFPPLHS